MIFVFKAIYIFNFKLSVFGFVWVTACTQGDRKTVFDSLKLPSVRAVNQTEDFCSWFMLLISDADHQSHDTSAI